MKSVYTTIDIIPSHIPRQLAIELLQSHGELITLNPLVLDYRPIKAPRDAPNDEYYSSWYEVTQRIQFVPGLSKLGSSKLSFRGCFHDMPWGVQTHMYVMFGIELRHKYQVKGNQPGEPPEPRELGSDAPPEGLYLRIDTQIKCNFSMLGFIKKELKAASKTMIERMIKKAELIDAGILQAMFDDTGKLKTVNPNDKSRPVDPKSTAPFSTSEYGPNGMNLASSSQQIRNSSPSAYNRQSGYQHHGYPPTNSGPVEMAGDVQYGSSSSHLHPNSRYSTYSELGGSSPNQSTGRWSGARSEGGYSSHDGSVQSFPTAYSTPYSMGSPRYESHNPSKSFAAELPSNEAVPPRPLKEELSPGAHNEQRQPQQKSSYNPMDYAGLRISS